jgi:hypothetical protein
MQNTRQKYQKLVGSLHRVAQRAYALSYRAICLKPILFLGLLLSSAMILAFTPSANFTPRLPLIAKVLCLKTQPPTDTSQTVTQTKTVKQEAFSSPILEIKPNAGEPYQENAVCATALNASNFGTIPNATTTTIAHTVNAGTSRLMMVGISTRLTSTSVTAVSYKGLPLTRLAFQNNASAPQARVEIWYMKAPPLGAGNVIVNLSGNDNAVVGVATYNCVDQLNTFGTVASNSSNAGTNASVSVSSAVGETVFSVAGFAVNSTLAPGAGQTEHYDASSTNISSAGGIEPGAAGLVSMNWVSGIGGVWTMLGVSIRPGQTTNPGGVPNTRLWLKANANTSTVADGSPLSYWSDQTINGNDVSATGTAQPLYRDNAVDNVNFNPIIDFDGTDDVMIDANGILGSTTVYTNANLFVVMRTDEVKDQTVLFEPRTGGAGDWVLFHAPWQDGGAYMDFPNGASRIGGAWGGVLGTPYLWTGANNVAPATNKRILRRNGLNLFTSNTAGANFQGIGGNFRLGHESGTKYQHGRINEVIIYVDPVSPLQRQQVESYLAIKYGITLNQTVAQNYLASNGTTIYWNSTTNAGYNNNIAGIARDDDSGLLQKQSQSINTASAGNLVTFGLGNIATNNASNTSVFTVDRSAMLWGDNLGAIAFQSTENPPTRTRITREWKVQETGTVGSVKISIPASTSALPDKLPPAVLGTMYLLVDANGDFSTGATEQAMSLVGTNWETTIDLVNGNYFTFATVGIGPGGVSGATLWLKADVQVTTDAGVTQAVNGQDVQQWNDQSIFGTFDVSQTNAATKPTFITPGVNFNPSIDFDGNDWLIRAGLAPTSLLNVTGGTSQNAVGTVFTVGYATGANAPYNVLASSRGTGANLVFTSDHTPGIEEYNGSVRKRAGPVLIVDSPPNEAFIGTVIGTGIDMNSRYNGSAGIVDNNPNNSVDNVVELSIGAEGSTHNYPLIGVVNEVITYNTSLTVAQQNLVQGYLAIKYGITLYNQNYIASDGLTTFWNRTTNALYNYNIAGIARDDFSALYQKQSSSVNTDNYGGLVTMGLTTIASTNLLNTNTIAADKTAMMWGDNSGGIRWQWTETPTGRMRLSREWKIQETGTIGSVLLRVPDNSALSGSKLPAESLNAMFLLVDADGDFSTGASEIPMTLVGTNWELSNDFSSGQFFTFATYLPNAPGCVNTNLQLWFGANGGVTTTGANAVTAWNNQVPYSLIGSTTPTSTNPTFVPVGLNYNPTVLFAGGAQALRSTTIVPLSDALSPQNNEAFVVMKNVSGAGGAPFSLGNNGTPRFETGLYPTLSSLDFPSFANDHTTFNTASYPGIFNYSTTVGSPTTNTNHTNRLNGVATGLQAPSDGIATISASVSGPGYFTLGSNDGTTPAFGVNGEIAEVLFYNGTLTATEKEKIETHLAIKYGITLGHNYLGGDASILWSIAGNTPFNNRITGIGREDCQALNQKQSKSQHTGSIVAFGLGTLATSNSANPNTIPTDGQFLIVGDNNGATSIQRSNNPVGTCGRMTRIWKVQEIDGEMGNVAMQFDLTTIPEYVGLPISNLVLLVNNTTNFSTVVSSYNATANVSGLVSFPNVNLNSNQFFTIGVRDLGFSPTVSSNSPVCAGSELRLLANGGTTYNWSGPNGFTSVLRNPILANVPMAASGVYSVTIANGFGCSTVLTTVVDIENCDPAICVFELCNDATATGNILGSDPDGDPLTYTVVQNANNGTFVLAGNNFTYTPNSGFVGEDFVIIETCDDQGACVNCIKQFVVTNCGTPPICGTNNANTTCKGVPVTGALNATNPLPGVVTYSVQAQPTEGGTVSITGSNYTFTPDPTFEGIVTFTYRATNSSSFVDCVYAIAIINCFLECDGNGCGSNLVTGGTYNSGGAGANLFSQNTIAVTADAEYCFSATLLNQCATCPSTSNVSFFANGVLLGQVLYSDLPVGTSVIKGFNFNAALLGNPATVNLLITQTGFAGAGVDIFASSASLKIITGNGPPEAYLDAGISICKNSSFLVPVLANDVGVAAGFSLTIVTPPPAGQGTVSVVGDQILFTPATNYVGDASFTYQICNGSCCDQSSATVTVVDPAISLPGGVCVNGAATIIPVITGIDPNLMAFQWQSSINNVTWANLSGAIEQEYITEPLVAHTWFRLVATPLSNGCTPLISNSIFISQLIDMTTPVVSACIDQPLVDIATVSVTVSWPATFTTDSIEVIIAGQTKIIDIAGGATTPQTVVFNLPANGSTGNTITARFKQVPTLCPVNSTFDLPIACSNDSTNCDVLYLRSSAYGSDGVAFDNGLIDYINQTNGNKLVDQVLVQPDVTGDGTYDVNSPSTAVTVNLNDYGLIVIAPSTESLIAPDFALLLKDFSGSILNMNGKFITDLAMAAGSATSYNQINAYTDDVTSEDIYAFNNLYNTQSPIISSGNFDAEADAYLWANENDASSGINGVFFVYGNDDALPGVSTSHGRRVYLGYNGSGLYDNSFNNGVLPVPAASKFDPIKHLTVVGKDILDQALVSATLNCLEEICDNGIDDNGNGLIDCLDPDCGVPTIIASSNTPLCEGGTLLLTSTTTGGHVPYSYSWIGPASYTATIQDPTRVNVIVTHSGNYDVTVTDLYGCTGTATTAVVVSVGQSAVITATVTDICTGASVQLTATPSGGAGTCTLQWQSSPDGISWTDIAGETSTTFITPPIASTTQYQVVYTCSGAGCCD